MPPRWESPFEPPSHRDTALLAEVLGALQSQLTDTSADATAKSIDVVPPSAEVQELISAAVAELHRVAPPLLQGTGVAPVLGSGVVQELLRRQREARAVNGAHAALDAVAEPAPPPTVDERL
ncbi:MAG: hypothetical protein U0164_04700 [Gemmatimonadaceae bacterium]